MNLSRLTRSDRLPLSIPALRKVYSIASPSSALVSAGSWLRCSPTSQQHKHLAQPRLLRMVELLLLAAVPLPFLEAFCVSLVITP